MPPQGPVLPPIPQDTVSGTGGTQGRTCRLPGGGSAPERVCSVQPEATPPQPHPSRRGSALTCLSAAGKPAALGRGHSRLQPSGIRSARGRRERKHDPELVLRPFPHAPRLQLSKAPGDRPPRTLAPATSHSGLRRQHRSLGAGSEETGSVESRAGDRLSPLALSKSRAGHRHVSMVRARLPRGWVLPAPPRAAARVTTSGNLRGPLPG